MATSSEEIADAPQAAREAGLRYVSDAGPGIRRVRSGRGFRYVDADGKTVKDADTRARIRALVIPPAWTDVWISPNPRGHLQATGRDARGRKQYRYHDRWREVRDATKYDRLIAFARALPRLRRRVQKDLALEGLPREKVLATVVRLLETTLIRVGNPEYARDNDSFGLTTLRNRHVRIDGEHLRFEFRGKAGKEHRVGLRDKRLARIVKRCQDIPGYELFQYVDAGGNRGAIESADVNEYLRTISGEEYTAKHFRTWAGTVLTVDALRRAGAPSSQRQGERWVVAAIKAVAEELGNTPAVCRACYVHPQVIEGYLEGHLTAFEPRAAPPRGLRAEEGLTLAFLQAAAKVA